ncbi:MAG TPA: hypothetical protein VGB52_02760 [Actinomycetota bacterium]
MTNFTIDPLSPTILLFEVIWFAAAGVMLVVAQRSKSEWLKATFAAFGLSILGLHILAVLPSWWLYYAEGRLDWGGQGCVAFDMSCLQQTIKDSVVVVQNAVALGAFVVAFVIYQRKFPKQLASGEAKSEATGGYK